MRMGKACVCLLPDWGGDAVFGLLGLTVFGVGAEGRRGMDGWVWLLFWGGDSEVQLGQPAS